MKRIILLFIALAGLATAAFSQKIIDEEIDVKGKEAFMKFSFADDIVLEAWDKDYVQLHVEVDIDENRYNDEYALNIDKGSGKVELIEDIDFEKIRKLKGGKYNCNFNSDIHYSLKVPKNLKVKLETISGEVELLGCQGEMAIKSISGFIDYSIPKEHKAKIELSTVTGEVYSNVTFDKPLSKEISWVGTNQELSLNGGSTGVDLKTVSGDIFLRNY